MNFEQKLGKKTEIDIADSDEKFTKKLIFSFAFWSRDYIFPNGIQLFLFKREKMLDLIIGNFI